MTASRPRRRGRGSRRLRSRASGKCCYRSRAERLRPKQSLRRLRGGRPADGMQKAMLALAVLSYIAQPAASATRSETTGAEAIILYERGDLDFIAYFLGLAEGMGWSNSYLQFTLI